MMSASTNKAAFLRGVLCASQKQIFKRQKSNSERSEESNTIKESMGLDPSAQAQDDVSVYLLSIFGKSIKELAFFWCFFCIVISAEPQ